MKLRSGFLSWIKEARCPCCGKGTFEFIDANEAGILVNAETKGRVCIDNFWIPSRTCNNPLCKWSKIKKEVDAHNYTNSQEAWKKIEEI